jgi:hypothetical protein
VKEDQGNESRCSSDGEMKEVKVGVLGVAMKDDAQQEDARDETDGSAEQLKYSHRYWS